jgi:hypothetical protein
VERRVAKLQSRLLHRHCDAVLEAHYQESAAALSICHDRRPPITVFDIKHVDLGSLGTRARL